MIRDRSRGAASSRSRFCNATGLRFVDGDMNAPRVSVQSSHLAADEVVSLARRYGVPVVERPTLARGLARIEVGAEIPAVLYRIVAALFHELDSMMRRR